MALANVLFDTTAAATAKFPDAAVRAEIEALNPGVTAPNSITEPKLDNHSVSRRTIVPGAVGTDEIGAGEVTTVNYADDSITGDKLQDGTVDGDKAGIGVVTVVNSAGDSISFRLQLVTTAEYNGLSSPDSGTGYLITP